MRAEIPIVHLLSNSVNITSIVDSRIFPSIVPQGEKGNAITYHITESESYDTKTCYNNYHQVNVQISAFCTVYNDCANLVEAIRLALERKKGSFGTNPVVEVDNIFYQNSHDMGYLDNVNKYHKVITFKIFLG